MKRVVCERRPNWRERIESQGLIYAFEDDGSCYWNEGVFYEFSRAEIDALETATYDLDKMCLKAVEYSIANNRFHDFGIPAHLHNWIRESWERDEHTVYGRFDLTFDSANIKLLEYNADTPTSLLETAVIQWSWFEDLDLNNGEYDQFNTLHERLIEAWTRIRREASKRVCFAGQDDDSEDYITVCYLRDTAMQAGLETEFLEMTQIGWNAARREFVDAHDMFLPCIFKLYPWEWMAQEKFGEYLPLSSTHNRRTRWLEAPWKMLLSNKMLLRVLYELFPSNPYILRCEREPWDGDYVQKPLLSREGANVKLVQGGQTSHQTTGPYQGDCIYQECFPLPCFAGNYPVIGSWMVNGWACGIGIREDATPITTNMSKFTPHVFR